MLFADKYRFIVEIIVENKSNTDVIIEEKESIEVEKKDQAEDEFKSEEEPKV